MMTLQSEVDLPCSEEGFNARPCALLRRMVFLHLHMQLAVRKVKPEATLFMVQGRCALELEPLGICDEAVVQRDNVWISHGVAIYLSGAGLGQASSRRRFAAR